MNRRWWVFARVSVRLTGTLLIPLCVTSCHSSGQPPKAIAAPVVLSVAGGILTSGFSNGVLRQQRTIPSFNIMKHPVTWAEYNACVSSGKCDPADSAECGGSAVDADAEAEARASIPAFPGYSGAPFSQRSDAAPATCVGEKQAEAYCHAVDGRLPTLDEWFLAARGPSPQRFSWGDAPTSCDQHPFSAQLVSHLHADPGTMDGCPQIDAGLSNNDLAVGTHPHGASTAGVEDVLLTPGELLAPDAKGMFRACSDAANHCVVFGLDPGSIDAVEPFLKLPAKDGASDGRVIGHAYGFRCVTSNSEVSQ